MGKRKNTTYRQYKTSLIFTGSILVAGFVLQILIGNFNGHILQFPVNALLSAIIILTTIGLSFYNKSTFFKWFSGIPLSVTLSAALLVLSLIMGLIPQADIIPPDDTGRFLYHTGIISVTSSWPFILIYFVTLLNLACVISRRLLRFRLKDYGFYLNHMGLWILLVAAGMGSSDFRSYSIKVEKGETTDTGIDKNNRTVHLPFSIQLDKFTVEEYLPQLIAVSHDFTKLLPENKPETIQIEDMGTKGRILDWNIQIEKYYHRALLDDNGIPYPVDMPGGNEAIFAKAANIFSGEETHGWLYRGNPLHEHVPLKLGNDGWLLINDPEPKQFISEITLSTPDNTISGITISVNKPFRSGNWMIYQSGYDRKMGRLSKYSILMAVYDPWLRIAYLGIILLAGGAVTMLWGGRRKQTN